MGYNKIKHNRDDFFSNANLEYALLATSGLLVGILYYYDIFYDRKPEIPYSHGPRIFEPQKYDSWDNADIIWSYSLPDLKPS